MTAINPKAIRGPVTAVPVVAGKGVRFVQDVENNRVVVEADETVLFKNVSGETGPIVLSESAENFERVKILYKMNADICGSTEVLTNANGVQVSMNTHALYSSKIRMKGTYYTLQGTSLTPLATSSDVHGPTGGSFTLGSESNTFSILAVYGINRVASA